MLGVKMQISPVVGVTPPVRVTELLKLPLAATVIVEVAAVPAFTVTLVGLALRLMPPPAIMVTVTEVELVMTLLVPPVPLMTTV